MRAGVTHSPTPAPSPEFQPEHFPLCDGGAAPPVGTADRIERRQIQFLAAYYRLNQLVARLEPIRSGAVREDEQSVLREIQYAIRKRDDLEDKSEAPHHKVHLQAVTWLS